MGLFNSIKGRLGMMGAQGQAIAQNGVPQVPTNPQEAIQAATIASRDINMAQGMAQEAGAVANEVQNQPSSDPATPVPAADVALPVESQPTPTSVPVVDATPPADVQPVVESVPTDTPAVPVQDDNVPPTNSQSPAI